MQLSDRIGRRMKLQDLHILMTVVQAGSMGKAAERLNTVQPAISRSIADLEHALGVRLLDRHRQGIEPTEYGRALLDCGVAVFDDLRQGVKKIEFLADPTAGEVRIGCNPFLAESFVFAVVDRLSRRYPRIVFHLVAIETKALHRELNERNVDLLVARRFGPIADERQGFEFLFDDSYVVAAGAQSPWVRRRRIELAELVSQSWILPPPESQIGSVAMEAFRARGLDYPRVTVVTGTPQVRISFLATGRFLSIFPASALRFPTRHLELKVLPVELPVARVPIGIVTLKNRTLSPVAQLFIEHAREVAKPLAKKK
jgi:DNA-binding transcriptional LysR family regulator